MGKRKKRTIVLALAVAGILSIGTLAYANHTFTDVPENHTFHESIAWMQESGITIGCNPPANTEYCPEDFVTRGQMAAFFDRASKSRAFDAGTLDGKDSTDFVQQGEQVDDADTLDGLDSTEFVKKGDPAGDADTLDGKDSTEFVQQGDPVSDSDSLDGKDSTEFLSSSVTVREATDSGTLLDLNVSATADCETDEIVIGGGYETDGLITVNINDNHPTDGGWHIEGTLGVAGSITVYAICAATG